MEELFFFVSQTVNAFLSIFMLLLLARAIVGFFAGEDGESGLLLFLFAVTEPVVSPVRRMLARIPLLEESPIDFSFMATYLIIMIVQTALPL